MCRRQRRLYTLGLLQAPDVGDQSLNFLGLQTLPIRRHFVFSFFDCGSQFGVAFSRHRRIRETRYAHALSGVSIALSGRTMAHRAFRAVKSRALFVGLRLHAERECRKHGNRNSND